MWKDTPLYEYAQRLVKIDKGLMFQQSMDNSFLKNLVIDLNTQDQLFDNSVDSKNKPLFSIYNNRGYYSVRTEKQSRGRKKAGDPYTLFDTGDFYRSFKVSVYRDGILITADGDKEDTNLFVEYGEDIVGLTKENIAILANAAKEFFIKWYKQNVVK